MEIIFSSNPNMDKKRMYAHTRATSVSLKDVDAGTVIKPMEIVIFEDTNNRGEVNKVVSIVDANRQHYTSNSPYFIDELQYISNLMGEEEYEIRIIKNKSKAGRTYTTCEMVL